MATRNGSYQNHARIEWDYSVGSVGQNTTSVTVTVRAYLRMQGSYSINGNWPVNWSGSWGTSSNTQTLNVGGGQRVLIRSWSQTVTLTDSTQSRSLFIRVQHFWGSTQDTLNFSIPARYARTPTNPQINLVNDDLIRVAWTRQGTYTSVGIQRQTDTGSWSGRGSAMGNAGDWTDPWVDPNRRYRYRFQGRNAQGPSAWSTPTEYIYTRPGAVGGVSAARSGSGIIVSATDLTPWATHYDIESDQDGIVGSAVARSSLPWLHTNPSASQPQRYRVRARVNSGGNDPSVLVGPWSAWSNTVQLIQPPNAPTNLSPNGAVVDRANSVTFSWRHNSVDSSAQSSAELRYRKTGTTSWTTRTITGSTQQLVESLSTLGAGGIQWQVRTKGAHPDFSPWSALASLTLIDAPTVAILQPESIHRSIRLIAQWSYSQAQDRPQSNWQVQLVNTDTGALVESRSGSGSLSSLNMNARLEPDTNYLVRVRAATGSVWSDWAEMPFVTEFVPPREPIVEGEWNEETGSYNLTIEDADCTDGGILYQNLAPNPSMEATSGTVEVRRNLCTNPSFESTFGGGGWTTVLASFERSNEWSASGDWSAKVTGDVNNSNNQGDMRVGAASVFPFGMEPGKTYTISATMHTPAAHNGFVTASTSRQRRIIAGFSRNSSTYSLTYGDQAPNDTGVHRVSVTISVPTDATGVIILLGSAGSGQDPSFVTYWDSVLVEETSAVRPYFDGDTSPDTDLTAAWTGDAGASESVLTGLGVENLSRWSASSSFPWQVTDDPYIGDYAARFQINTTGSISVPIASVSLPVGTRATAVAAVRPPRDMRMGIRVGGSPIFYEDVIGGQWNVLRRTDVSASAASAASRLVWPPNQFEVGDWLDVDAAMIVPVEEGEEYTGPYHDGDDVGWGWEGEPHASSSTELERPASTSVVIERSIDGGDTWEHVTEASFEDCTLSVSDFEGLSCGTTLYRVTNSAATGASIDVVHEGLADSEAIWLGTGEGFVQTARISLHDGVGISRGRERSLEHYQGRSLGVAYMSENLHRTISVQGMVPDTDMLRCPSVTRDELESIIVWPYPTHLHRDMHGNRIYGIAGNVGLDREWIMAHRDCGEHQGLCGLGLWTFRYDIDETESR